MHRRSTPALLLALALLAAACGGGSGDGERDASGLGGTTATTEPGDDAELDLDATLRYAAANAPSRLDPHRSSNGFDQNWLAPAYERLLDQTAQGELIPGLATE